jgi:hypothetical protein
MASYSVLRLAYSPVFARIGAFPTGLTREAKRVGGISAAPCSWRERRFEA